jgi:hypothetical protein
MATMKSVLSPSYTSSVEAQTEGWEWLVVVPLGWGRSPKLKSAISLARQSGYISASKVMNVFRVKPDVARIDPCYGDLIHTCESDAPCNDEQHPPVRCANAPVCVFKRSDKGVVKVLMA